MEEPIREGPPLSNREQYIKFRKTVEEHFLATPPEQKIVEKPDGARTRVLSHVFNVPDELKKPSTDGKKRIAIFLSGLFKMNQPNMGTYPLESRLLANLLTRDVDVVMVLKGEGLNRQAYTNADGTAAIERKVAEAAVDILEEKLALYKEGETDSEYVFEASGYSEGCTQGASLLREILERNIGKVKSYIAIGGEGLAGVTKQEDAPIIPSLNKSKQVPSELLPLVKNAEGEDHTGFEGDDAYFSAEIIGAKHTEEEKRLGFIPYQKDTGIYEGLEGSLGNPHKSSFRDIRNISVWGLDYLRTKLFRFQDGVPDERVRAVFTQNPDFDYLATHNVPVTVFSGTEDQFFSPTDIYERVKKLRQLGGKVLFVTAPANHEFAHYNPSGLAFALRATQEKAQK